MSLPRMSKDEMTLEAEQPPVTIGSKQNDDGGTEPPNPEKVETTAPHYSTLKPEQLGMVEAAFPNSQGEDLDALDVDTVTKLLVDLRPDVSQEQIDELMERFDAGFTGEMQKAQVLQAAEAVCGYELEKEQMDKAFGLFDRDGNGLIPLDRLKAALQEGKNALSNEEIGSFLTLSRCKTETWFDFRKFVDQVAYAPIALRTAPKKKKASGKKR